MSQNSNLGDWEFIWQNMSDGMAQNPGRNYRFQKIIEMFPDESNLKVLDFGCGTGNLLAMLQKYFPLNQYTGADSSATALERTLKKAPGVNAKLIQVSGDDAHLDLSSDSFDVVVCSEVFEHIKNENKSVSLIYDLVKPGGTLLCSVPAGPMSHFDRFIGHHRHYSKAELRALLENSGFTNVHICRAGFPAVNILRIFTILYGKRLVTSSQKSDFGAKGFSGLMVASLSILFRFTLRDSVFGWQLIANAKKPAEIHLVPGQTYES
jgi:SAM-dependent methyltransferase